MLIGRQISLRPLRADDIGPLHQGSLDLEARGPWYPLPTTPLGKYEAAFAGSGFWSRMTASSLSSTALTGSSASSAGNSSTGTSRTLRSRIAPGVC